MVGNMWEKLIRNPQALHSLYKKLPELDNLQISMIKLSYNGPTLFICMDFSQFPDFPSKKWPLNATHFSAVFSFSLEEITIKKFGTQNIASISCESLENSKLISVSLIGADLEVRFTSYIGKLDSFSAV